MFEELLGSIVTLLAFTGGAALLSRLLRAGTRTMLRAAEVAAAATLADASAGRGDVTGMMERRAAESSARRQRRSAMALSVLWLTWLVVPVFAGFAREAFAFASLLWLVPGAPPRLSKPPGVEVQ